MAVATIKPVSSPRVWCPSRSRARVSAPTMRRLRSRAATDPLLGGEREALISPRRLSLRASVYDPSQLTRHWFDTHVMGREGI